MNVKSTQKLQVKHLVCIDSNVFISYFNETPGRYEEIATVIDAARGECVILLPAIVHTEVYGGQGKDDETLENHRIIDAEFTKVYYRYIASDRVVSNAARTIMRKQNLSPTDAQVAATALLYDADVLHTYDGEGKKNVKN